MHVIFLKGLAWNRTTHAPSKIKTIRWFMSIEMIFVVFLFANRHKNYYIVEHRIVTCHETTVTSHLRGQKVGIWRLKDGATHTTVKRNRQVWVSSKQLVLWNNFTQETIVACFQPDLYTVSHENIPFLNFWLISPIKGVEHMSKTSD